MTIIVCLDNANGMMFNHRRQSRDANVTKDILETAKGHRLVISPYSAALFAGGGATISNDPLADAGDGDYCFIEDANASGCEDKASGIIVYKWNRDYPADTFFGIDYAGNYKLSSAVDFVGTSHDKITKEVYVK